MVSTIDLSSTSTEVRDAPAADASDQELLGAVRSIRGTKSQFEAGRPAGPLPRSIDMGGASSPLVESADPIVVFASLAKVTAPRFADLCWVVVSQGEEPLFRLVYPVRAARPDDEREVVQAQSVSGSGGSVTASFSVDSELGHDPYFGEVRCFWDRPSGRPQEAAALLRLLVDRAVQVVRIRRMQERAEAAEARSAALAAEVIGGRTVAEATGYLAGANGLSYSEAEGVLRRGSRAAQQSLVDYAAELLARVPSGEVSYRAFRALPREK